MTYEHALTKWDHTKIDKLNKLTNTETFWEDVYQLRKMLLLYLIKDTLSNSWLT